MGVKSFKSRIGRIEKAPLPQHTKLSLGLQLGADGQYDFPGAAPLTTRASGRWDRGNDGRTGGPGLNKT